jgi:hypothetical protein
LFIFFYGRVGHIVFGETDPLFAKRAKVERVVLNALVKVDAARWFPRSASSAARRADEHRSRFYLPVRGRGENERQAARMRTLTVSSLHRQWGRAHCKDECIVPSIRLNGKWLAALGLEPGQRVRVIPLPFMSQLQRNADRLAVVGKALDILPG